MGIEPTTSRLCSHTSCRCATTGLTCEDKNKKNICTSKSLVLVFEINSLNSPFRRPHFSEIISRDQCSAVAAYIIQDAIGVKLLLQCLDILLPGHNVLRPSQVCGCKRGWGFDSDLGNEIFNIFIICS